MKGRGEWHIGKKPRKVLKPGINPQGYRIVCIRNNEGRAITQKVAKLVLEAFVGPRPNHLWNPDVCHNDDVRTNDHLDNLRWDSHRQNMLDRIRNQKKKEAS